MGLSESDQETSTDPAAIAGSVSPFKAGVTCRCPTCGKGVIYDGLLTLRTNCDTCNFDLSKADPGDGPAVFVIFILGAIATILALIIDNFFAPPLWAMALIMSVVIFGGAIWLLRMMKALLIALQFRHGAQEIRSDDQINREEN